MCVTDTPYTEITLCLESFILSNLCLKVSLILFIQRLYTSTCTND